MNKEIKKDEPTVETDATALEAKIPTLETPKLDEAVKVPRSTLDKLIKQLDDQKGSIKRLEYAASKAGLSKYDARNAGAMGKNAAVSVYDGKIVVAWKMMEDIVEKHPLTNAWIEKQTIRLWFHGSEAHEDVPYQQFSRRLTKKKVVVKKESQHSDGMVIWEVETVETDDTKPVTLEISTTFLN